MHKRDDDRESFSSWNINANGDDNFDVTAPDAPLFRTEGLLAKRLLVLEEVKATVAARDCERSSVASSLDVIILVMSGGERRVMFGVFGCASFVMVMIGFFSATYVTVRQNMFAYLYI